jgi:uroporphyrinogen decarboxylase
MPNEEDGGKTGRQDAGAPSERNMSPENDSSLYRERFACTLAHQPVDRCPIDLGGTPQSTIEDPATETALAGLLGLSVPRPDAEEGGWKPPLPYDKCDWRILERFDVDFRRAGGIVPFKTGREGRISETQHADFFGIRTRFSGQHWSLAEGPLQHADIDQVAAYAFPTLDQMDPALLGRWEGQARALREHTPFVIVGEHPVFGVLELACWLCGYDHVMLMMAADPDWVHLLFGKILAFQKLVIAEYYRRIGPWIHLTTSGDDFGTQHGLFMSPDMFREFVAPYMRERIAHTTHFTDAVYMHHSCGAVFDIVPDLIGMGVRILNPIQPKAQGMDPQRLKAAYGREIVFHGGLDTQEVLPSNNRETIACAVQELLRIMNPTVEGGYIFAPAHNLQRDVSPQSIVWMYDAAAGRT